MRLDLIPEELRPFYQRALLKRDGDEKATDEFLIVYGLKRQKALWKDNTAKAAGLPAAHTYKTRNGKATRGKCEAVESPLPGAARCMLRNGHKGEHEF